MILSEVHDVDNMNAIHEIHNKLQHTNIVVSEVAYVNNNNIILYEQYMKHNEESIVPNGASYERNDEHVLLESCAHLLDDSLTIRLNTYKDQVAIYDHQVKFELNKCKQFMDDQMRLLVQEQNAMEEKFKRELHVVQFKRCHTTRNYKEIQETINTLQMNFKHKENEFLTEFSRLTDLNLN